MDPDLRVIKAVQQEMIRDRGFFIPDYDTIDTLNQEYSNPNGETLYVHYCLEETLSETMDFFVKHMEDVETGILIGTEDDMKLLTTKTYKEYFKALILKDVHLFTIYE